MTITTKVKQLLWQQDWQEAGQSLPAKPHPQAVRSRPIGQVQPVGTRDEDAGAAYYAQNALIGMKLVSVVHGAYYSLMEPGIRYQIGVEMRQLARPNHEGGYYMYLTDSALQLVQRLNEGAIIDNLEPGTYGVLECRGYGPFVGYDEYGRTIPLEYTQYVKKVACTILVPTYFYGEFQFAGLPRMGGRPNVTVTRRGSW